MPIYEYACQACGFEKEHLQKMSDVPITNCPACGSDYYVKKVSAAGFQLKGTGWYVTDFRNKQAPQPSSKSTPESGKETAATATANTAPATSNAASTASSSG